MNSSAKRLVILTVAGLAGAAAHAQYAAPRADSYTPPVSPAEWEIDAGVGYLAGTNLSGADNGVAGHIGGYHLDPLDATHETTLKYGAEFFGSDASGKLGGADVHLTTYFVSADMGVTYGSRGISRRVSLAVSASAAPSTRSAATVRRPRSSAIRFGRRSRLGSPRKSACRCRTGFPGCGAQQQLEQGPH